ncbi:MAG: GNAT family N-acetyltransferase [Oscillospiraceae bacterium]|jgi:GNAT superfamily N-acetyltransferase|nr:GNAT family N-acetyltransferase [Oscillospiraceae bacterium]
MLTLLAALPPAWGEGGGLAAPFSPLDYGAICTLSALASSGEAGGIWAQTDGAGNPLALVSARFLSLAIPYPQERGEELRLFLSGFPSPLLCLPDAASSLGLAGEESRLLLCRALKPGETADPLPPDCPSGELWAFLRGIFPGCPELEPFRATLFAGRKSGRRLTLPARDTAGCLIACAEMAHCHGGTAILENIAVSPAHRGKGLGRAVTEALCRQLASRGLKRALVACRPALRPFYEGMGFAPCGWLVKV